MQPMAGFLVAIPLPTEIPDDQQPSPLIRTRTLRTAIVLAVGELPYAFDPWNGGLEDKLKPGCVIAYDDGWGISVLDGFVYVRLGAIVSWKPAPTDD